MASAAVWIPYCGAAPEPAELLLRWNLDPLLLAGLAGAAYAWRFLPHEADGRARWAVAGWALLAILFVSPFCALTSALFSARVVHHVLLVGAAAPMLALALPAGLRLPGRLSIWTALQALVFWLWHAPPAYAWALSGDAPYWLMQLSLLGSAIGFWHAVQGAPGLAGVAGLLATTVQMGLLGALITFAGVPLYAPHLLSTQAWGLAPLQDQQLAGLIMWVPAAGVYLAAALVGMNRWLARQAGSVAG